MESEPAISSCTTILVGKNATYDGSTMMARTVDCPAGHFFPVKFTVMKPADQPKVYKSVETKCEIPLPENPLQYTQTPLAFEDMGIWGEAGVNTLNVAVSETETIANNGRVLGADPLVKTGIGEEDILTITLPYIKNAREGVKRLGEILEKYGTYEMNGIGFQDENEVWWLETIGGHHWIAKRVPDDGYVINPNQQGIKSFDFVDAFGEQKDHMCSKDLVDFVTKNNLNLTLKPKEELSQCKDFDVRAAFGTHSPFDRAYNTPRAWYTCRYLNPKTYKWDGPNADFTPESDDLPWSLVPEHKVTVEDIKFILSSYYQGTIWNPYARYGNLTEKGKYRPIGVNRTYSYVLTHIRGSLPDKIKPIEWIGFGSGAFNAFVPQYARVDDTPAYLKNTTKEVTTENLYWANRLIAALADSSYNNSIQWVERYQNLMEAKGHEFINQFDKKFLEGNVPEKFLEDANNTIADFTKKETTKCLDKVLLVASNQMKNAYARSDA